MNARWLTMLVVLTSACRTAQAAARYAAEPPPVPVVRFRSGATAFSTYSGIDDSLRIVVRDSSSWTNLWRRIQRPFFPRPAAPRVDFAREMVIAVALGQRPNAGYDIIIERAQRTADGLLVDVRVTSPSPGCPVEAVMTQPVDLGRVPATDAPIRFREHRVTIPCDAR